MSQTEPEKVNEPTTDAMTMTNEKFWTNEVIWKEITSYLRISDLKALSVVNKQFLDKIRRNPRIIFKQTLKTKLKVYPSVLNKAVVEVNSIDEHFLEHLGSDVFENVTHLEFQRLGRISDEIRNRILQSIICNCKLLKSLAFSTQNFFLKNYQKLFRDEEVKQILSKLDELCIGIENNDYEYEDSDEEDLDDSDDDYRGSTTYFHSDKKIDPHENFKLFADINFKLKKFSYHESDTDECENTTHFYPEVILKSSFKSLVDIDLCFHISGLKQLSSIEDNIPNLTKLQIQVFGDQIQKGPILSTYDEVITGHLLPFIDRYLETLQIFTLHGHIKYSLAPICETLKNLKKIRSISLKNERSFTNKIQSVNWDFLQTLSTLRSFELQIGISFDGNDCDESSEEDEDEVDDEEDDDEDVMFLRRSPYSDRWLRYLVALPPAITSICMYSFEEISQLSRCEVTGTLERFQNLTELSMLQCSQFLFDDTLQCICTHLKKLRIFKADFDGITDFGISGCRPDGSDSGVSLKNLTGLGELVMSENSNGPRWKITWDGLIKSVKFLELFHLTIRGLLKDVHGDGEDSGSKDGYNYLKLLQQNPSLERCDLKFYTPRYWFRQEALEQNPRLKLKRQ